MRIDTKRVVNKERGGDQASREEMTVLDGIRSSFCLWHTFQALRRIMTLNPGRVETKCSSCLLLGIQLKIRTKVAMLAWVLSTNNLNI